MVLFWAFTMLSKVSRSVQLFYILSNKQTDNLRLLYLLSILSRIKDKLV